MCWKTFLGMRSPGVRPSAAGRGVEPSSWERLWEQSGCFQKRGPRQIERELAVWIEYMSEAEAIRKGYRAAKGG
jgi:hypothetical protein